MNIGIDAQIFRSAPCGIYNYLWNLAQWICRSDSGNDLSLVFYGPHAIDKKENLDRLRSAFPQSKIRHTWDGWPLLLLSEWNVHQRWYGHPLVRTIDKGVVQAWTKLHKDYPSVAFPNFQRTVRRRAENGNFKDFDVFHHPFGLVFPLHDGANVLTIHDLIPRLLSDHYPGALAWFGESFQRAHEMDLILTPSENTKADVMEFLKVPEERIRVTPLAAHEQYRPLEDPEEVKSVLAKYGIGTGPYVLSVGALEYRRNIHRLLEAFHILKQEQKTLDHKLVLVGGKGESCQIIFETIDKLDLRDDIRWLGQVPFDDLPALINGAEAFVYPSTYEGFGLPPLEAMACGTPVVSSRAASLPEVVGDAGVLFDPCDVEAMAAALHAVLTNENLRKELRIKGLTRARRFSWQRTAELTLSAYAEAYTRFREDGVRHRVSRRYRTKAQDIILNMIFNDLRRRYDEGSKLK